jgi:hypothetical protein
MNELKLMVNSNPPGISAPKKHAYVRGCDCKRCAREWMRRSAQSVQSAPKAKLRRTKPAALRHASREEQHARYIDSGHNDDIGASNDY